MRTTRLLMALCFLAAALPAEAGDNGTSGTNACQAKPTAQCLAGMAFAIGETLPDQEAARYRLAQERAKQDLKGGLEGLLTQGDRPLSVADHVSHFAALGDFAKARALIAESDTPDRAQGYAVLAAALAQRHHLQNSRKHLHLGEVLARKLKGRDADLYAHYAAQALMELGSDDLAQEAAGHIADDGLRFQTLLSLAQRQWELKRKDSARASLTAAEDSPGADALAVARQWRLFGDEDAYRRALDNAERHATASRGDSADRDLSSIAVDLQDGGDVSRIHDQITRLPDPDWRAQALVTLANALPPAQSGDAEAFLSEAANLAGRLINPADKDAVEALLVHGYALQGDHSQASRHLSQIKEPRRRAGALIDLGGLQAPKDKKNAADLFSQAQDEILRQNDAQYQDIALRDLIWAERRAGLDDLARPIPDLIGDPQHRLLALAELGDWNDFDKAAKTTRPSDRDLQAVAAGHAIDGRFADLLETVNRIGSPALKAESLASAAALAAQLAP